MPKGIVEELPRRGYQGRISACTHVMAKTVRQGTTGGIYLSIVPWNVKEC